MGKNETTKNKKSYTVEVVLKMFLEQLERSAPLRFVRT